MESVKNLVIFMEFCFVITIGNQINKQFFLKKIKFTACILLTAKKYITFYGVNVHAVKKLAAVKGFNGVSQMACIARRKKEILFMALL